MASAYQMQVIERGSGRVVASWPPGLQDEESMVADIMQRVEAALIVALVADVVPEVVTRVQAEQVGFFRTEARVLGAVQDVVRTVLRAKLEALVGVAVKTAVEDGMLALKSKVRA